MPDSPSTTFNFINNNEVQSTPSLGVSHILARTTLGPYLDASVLIKNIGQFRSIYGQEIVPNGSVSNIETALRGGSQLRIVRVKGSGTAAGSFYAAPKPVSGDYVYNDANSPLLTLSLTGAGLANKLDFNFKIKTKTLGDHIGDLQGHLLLGFTLESDNTANNTVDLTALNRVVVGLYDSLSFTTGNLLQSSPLVVYQNGSADIKSYIDVDTLRDFINNNKYLDVTFESSTEPAITNIEQVYNALTKYQGSTNGNLSIKIGTESHTGAAFKTICMAGSEGTAGVAPTADEWVKALSALADYNDAYQLGCSHLSQHLTVDADEKKVHKAAKDLAEKVKDFIYYIDLAPTSSYNADTVITKTKGIIASIGYSRYVAYFYGGYKYYDDGGNLRNCDNLGTVLGLGDTSAAQHGPYRSFAGSNRGIVDCAGIVAPNYGSPSNSDIAQSLAKAYINLSVIKDTKSQGKRVMLWHNFTSNIKNDSNKLISSVRLSLFLKKNIKPIIESYIEEPNDIPTWANIFYDVKPSLEDLVTNRAIFSYEWQGDQDAKSLADLTINSEAGVRAGKYHVILTYKDIVTLQSVTIDFVVDSVSRTVTANIK